MNLSADWLVCLRVSAGGEGSRYQPLRYHGQRLRASSSRRSLSSRDFHGYFSSFRGIHSLLVDFVCGSGLEENNFFFRIYIWHFPCQNQCCHATRTDQAVLIMILTRRWTHTVLSSDRELIYLCHRWSILPPTSTTSSILSSTGWNSVRQLEIW